MFKFKPGKEWLKKVAELEKDFPGFAGAGVNFIYDHEQTLADYEETLAKQKDYTLDYVFKNPPKYAQNTAGKEVWKQAVIEYLDRHGLSKVDLHKPIKDIQWPEVIRIFNTLMGKKNRPRSQESKERMTKKPKVKKVAELTLGESTVVYAEPKYNGRAEDGKLFYAILKKEGLEPSEITFAGATATIRFEENDEKSAKKLLKLLQDAHKLSSDKFTNLRISQSGLDNKWVVFFKV